jgi:hypothetical protein
LTVVFNIGSQQAGVVNNVAGDQHLYGGQHAAMSMDVADVRALLAKLREDIMRSSLPDNANAEAEAEIDAAAAELSKPQPDKRAIAGRLTELTKVLTAAGALATAGTGLGGALAAVAGWLGNLGEPIRNLLSR